MSKKKNTRRKKSNNLLKGMAAAGAVVGGGTFIVGNNTVYAAENDLNSTSGSGSLSELKTSESAFESLSALNEDQNTNGNNVGVSATENTNVVNDFSEEETSGKLDDGVAAFDEAIGFDLEGTTPVEEESASELTDNEYQSVILCLI